MTKSYDYDASSQLTALSYQLGTNALGNLAYTYDLAGRRTTVGGSYGQTNLPSPLASASYNANNQLTQFGTSSLTYDLNGNLTMTGSSAKPYQYTGRENDGTGLYYYRARYYNPVFQLFISEDPMGFTAGSTSTLRRATTTA